MCAEQNSTISATGLAKPPPEWQTRKLSLKQRKFSHFTLGESGEIQARKFIEALGWQIKATNIRFSRYEVDIVAVDPDNKDLVFVEVKTRSNGQYGDPSLAVSRKKIWSLHQLAKAYLQKISWHGNYRFDTISVLPDTIHHYRNVTWLMR